MSSRIVFESWQLVFPVAGFVLFVAVFLGALWRACRMRRRSVQLLEQLPLDHETTRSASHVRPE